jgi:hypothetical protein
MVLGMMTLDVSTLEIANALMELMQKKNLGYLAVSLGFYKTYLVPQEPLHLVKFLWKNK